MIFDIHQEYKLFIADFGIIAPQFESLLTLYDQKIIISKFWLTIETILINYGGQLRYID